MLKKNQLMMLFSSCILLHAIHLNAMDQSKVQLIEVQHEESSHKAIYRKDIFEFLTGHKEDTFFQHLKKNPNILRLPDQTKPLIDNLYHEINTLDNWRERAKSYLLPENKGTLSIVKLDVVQHPELRHLIDVGALQAKHPGAVFQTASRTNGLEGGQISYQNNKDRFDPKKNGFGSIIGKYAVQGEEAQISTPLKGIAEIYMLHDKINFFSNLGIKIDACGNISDILPETLPSIRAKSVEELSDNIQVALWQNVPVTSGYANVLYQSEAIAKNQKFEASVREKNNEDANILVWPPHLISQVNVAAVDMDHKRSSMATLNRLDTSSNNHISEKIAKAALIAAYEATIYCALIDGKKDVFLSLVGCGSFKNKLEWVKDILTSLHKNNIIKHSGLNITLMALEANGQILGKSSPSHQAWLDIEEIAKKSGGTLTYDGAQVHPSPKAILQTKPDATLQPTPTNNPKAWWRNYMLGLGGLGAIIASYILYKYIQQNR